MENSIAMTILIYLGVAIIMVPLGRKLGLSSVIGYILGGIVIGPFCLQLSGKDVEDIMHASELGVVMLLFLVGLELDPRKLWQIRKRILGLGLSQMLLSIAGILMVFFLAGFGFKKSFIIALCFAMSSTAIVLQTLKEKNLFRTLSGEASFSILLFQDLAVIPILFILPFLSGQSSNQTDESEKILLQYLPEWAQPFSLLIGITMLILLGRFVFTPFLRYVSKYGLNELLTAASLFLVIGVSELMHAVGLSAALGAFVAGVMLANSEFRHELESDIDPFKGLLLAFFFVSVGATINFDVIAQKPFFIFSAAIIVLIIKAIVLFYIAKKYKMSNEQSLFLAFALSQIGEFAFVLVNFAASLSLIDYQANSELMAIVAITMCITPFLLIIKERFLDHRFVKRKVAHKEKEHPVIKQRKIIIVGFGFFGSTVGRLLKANGIRSTVLDNDPDRVALLRSHGFNVYYGDATKPALLRAAGIEEAELLVLCLDDPAKNKFLVNYVKENYPHIQIFTRAKNRLDAYEFIRNDVNKIYRETLGTAVEMAVDILEASGMRKYTARRMGKRFMLIDKAMTKKLATEKDQDMYTFTFRETLEREAELLALDSISFEENYWSEQEEDDDIHFTKN